MEITCFNCNTLLSTSHQIEEARHTCPKCRTGWTCYAITPVKTPVIEALPLPRGDEGEATCYNHENNLASSGCSNCGRLLCSVCSLNREGKVYCPSCWNEGKAGAIHTTIKTITRYDFGATGLAAYSFFSSYCVCIIIPLGWVLLGLHMFSPPPVYRNNIPIPIIPILIYISYALYALVFVGAFANGVTHAHH